MTVKNAKMKTPKLAKGDVWKVTLHVYCLCTFVCISLLTTLGTRFMAYLFY